jgi:hypothetical protein
MPDFLTIKRQHDAAKLKGLMSQDSSLADFAKLGALATDDPSYQQVAESPAWKNMIRGWSANVDEAIQSGPIDDWTAGAFGAVGDLFGVTPDVSRAAGRELPRQVLNFLPMAVGAGIGSFGGPAGTAAGAKIGLGLTSGLSAFDAYGKGGTATDAIVGGVAPYLGGKLSEFGSKAALRSAATPGSFLNRAGFMKGKDILNPATHTITDAATGLSKQVLGETVDTFRDKALGYVAGETLANVGFTGLDLVQQGPDAVLNRDYLFANLASNIPFMAADIPNFTKTRFAWEPTDAPLVPTRDQINAEKTRGEVTRESLEAIDNSLAKFQKEAELGVDIGRFISKNNEVAATMEGHRTSIKLEAENFKNTWNQLREVNTALPDVLTGIDPKVLMQNPSVIGFDPAKNLVQEYAQKLKQINKVKGGNLSRIAKSDADLERVMGLVEEDLKLPDTLLSTPVAERTVEQYQKALGTKLSDNAVKLIRMKHMEIAQGENFVPEFPKLWEEHNKALTGKFEGSIDDRYELITASLLAKGKFPKVVKAQKKAAQEAQTEGLTGAEANVNATSKMATLSKAEQRAAAKAKRDAEKAAADAKAVVVDPLKAAVDARVAAAKAAVTPTASAAEKPKVGRPEGLTPETVAKNADMEERILLAGKALSPTDQDRFFIIGSTLIEKTLPENRSKGLNWMNKIVTEHAALSLPEKLAMLQAGLKTAGGRAEKGKKIQTVPLKEEVTPDPVEETVSDLGADDFESEKIDLSAVAEVEQAIRDQRPLKTAETEAIMGDLIVEITARELDGELPEIDLTAAEKTLVSNFLVKLAAKLDITLTPYEAWTRFAKMNESERKGNLALANQWKEKGFGQLAAKDIDPLTVHFTTGQPLPIKEFATAWAREAGIPEAEIPATVDDFVRITQMFSAGEARFGKLEGTTAEGAQFARAPDPVGTDLRKVTTGYERVSDALLGFTKDLGRQKGYEEQNYKYTLPVEISTDGGKTWYEDAVKGLNYGHAVEKAKRAWDSDVQLRLISKDDPRVADIAFAQGGTIYGVAFKDIAQAFFSTKAFQGPNKTKAMGYVLAHEMGHIAFGKAMRGEYGAETKQLFDEAIAWVKTNDPAVLRDVEEIIRELYLPKEMKNLDGVRDVLGNLEPEEWMANAHAMMVTSAMQANKPIKALLLLPKPIRTVVENTIRRIQDALKMARIYWKLSGEENKSKLGQVLRVKEMVDSVRQKFREAEWQTAQAMEFLDVNPAGLMNRMENAQFARSPYPVEGVRQKLGNFFNNSTQGLGGFMATYRSFIEPGFRLLNSGNVVTEQVSESLTPIFGHKGATDNIVVDKSLPWFKLANSKPLYDLTKRINLDAQDSKVSAIVQNADGTVSFNWLTMSPEHRAEVKLYNPDQQKAMAQFLMQKEQSTRLTQKHNVEHETNKARMFAVNLVTRMKSFDQGTEPALRHKEARVVAEKLFDAMAAGDQVAVKDSIARFADPREAQKLVDIIQEKQGKLASLAKFYADQPNFQSLRRFKPIIQRYTDANGESKVLDFNKGSEALAMRKELEAKGWKAVGEPITREYDKKYKNEFTVDSKVVDLLESKEGRLKDLIQSMDIDPADRDALLGESSFLADVLREAKSNDIYLPGVKRRVSGGPEHLDMLEQHLTYTQAAHKVGYMTALGEELKYHMNNPELKDQLREKTQFMEFYKQAKESDPKFWRVVNKANAVWHIGFNLPGHLAELFQPIQTHIHEAVYQGHSMLTALRTTAGAEKSAMAVIGKLIKSKIGYHDDAAIWENWPDKDEAAMLRVNWRRSLTQPLQEVYQQVGVNQETLRGIVQDREMLSPSKILTKPLNMYSNAAMGLYSVFTQHNNLVGLLTGYRLAKKKGLSHDEAVKSAALFELTANNSGGRTERPVYFGKLGSAGYMVYALSSYVRGRFTDLARYYRHGFDKVNFPELDQSDRRAARQAFASMIAGQLAAAGILGFPFVGAGIALMEDLTGDEIKGQGLDALNEMTDDPLLTQALSYGVMSSMAESLGIPADLHSRFALGGFMGLNAYDGISAASVLGPTASMVNSMWKMGKSLVQEKDLGAAFRAGGPGGIKRMSEALSQEFQAENPDANLPMAMAGFRSGKMFKNKEMERIISKTNEAAQNDIKLAAKKVEESLLLGPEVAQKTLMREANGLIDQRLEGRGRQLALKDMMSNLRQRIALQKVKEQMPSDLRGKATAQTASKVSNIAQAVGYQPPPAGNVEQEQIMRTIYQQLGGQRSPGSMRRARERQMELQVEPGTFY